MTRTVSIVAILLTVAILLPAVGCSAKPLCHAVTVDGVKSSVKQSSSHILAMINDNFHKLNGTDAFAAAWCFDEWTLTDTEPTGEDPLVSLCFSELYIVELFESGHAAVYDGYAPRGEQSYAFYTIPVSVTEDVKAFLEANAEPCEIGDANRSTFVHHNIRSVF